VAGGRGRGGIDRRGWFHRRQHKRSPPHTTDTVDTADPVDTAGVAQVAPPDSGNEAGGTADESAPPSSFDQVLRRAAEFRDHERDPDD
jgi:hypothetical protein